MEEVEEFGVFFQGEFQSTYSMASSTRLSISHHLKWSTVTSAWLHEMTLASDLTSTQHLTFLPRSLNLVL